MDTMTQVRNLIKNNPEHAVTDGVKFEQMHKANPDDSGIRRVYFELRRQVYALHPVAMPDEVDPPAEAWDDNSHPFWASDPFTVWEAAYMKLSHQYGHINTRVIVSKYQADGKDLI